MPRPAAAHAIYSLYIATDEEDSFKHVELFKPFSLCGGLHQLGVTDTASVVKNMHLEESQCTIGCVNKTRDAFRIGVYACNEGKASFIVPSSFTLPISVTDMEFEVFYADDQFTVRGYFKNQQVIFSLQPNLSVDSIAQ
uniref:Uncharacterized protein n=1 Tax=Anopheles farauti TaxID=69004 RepID=A0A182QZJ1_9DIPT